MHGGSVASTNVLAAVEQSAYTALDAYFSSVARMTGGNGNSNKHGHSGGSLSSDAVMALVQPEAWGRMNMWFTNRLSDMMVAQHQPQYYANHYGGSAATTVDCSVTNAAAYTVASGTPMTALNQFTPPLQFAHPGNSMSPSYSTGASLPDVNVQAAYNPNVQLPYPTGVQFIY